MEELKIREASVSDAPQLLKIYAPYVEKTAVSFEYDLPSEEEFRARMENTLRFYPYLVAEWEGKIAGYAYAGRFHTRAAYGWNAESSIYVAENMRRKGIGKSLYDSLERCLREMGILTVNACIASPVDAEDAYLSRDSEEFHRRMGFEKVAEFHRCGYKFGRWYHMIWMEKDIGTHSEHPKPVIPFPEVRL